jgi:hypothetical protein
MLIPVYIYAHRYFERDPLEIDWTDHANEAVEVLLAKHADVVKVSICPQTWSR